MQTYGIVVINDGPTAQVRIQRHTACNHCGGCAVGAEHLVTALNPLGANPGQKVAIEMPASQLVRAAAIVYLLPLIFFLVGFALGTKLLYPSLVGGILGALVFLALAVACVIKYDRKMARCRQLTPRITRVIA